jgi:peptidoglycan hydrolase CwlO-like protein
MAEEALALKTAELLELQASYDEFIASSGEVEAELVDMNNAQEESFKELDAANRKLQDKLESLTTRLKEASSTRSSSGDAVEAALARAEKAERRVTALEQSNEQFESRVRILESTKEDLEARLELSQEEVVFAHHDVEATKEESKRLKKELTVLHKELAAKDAQLLEPVADEGFSAGAGAGADLQAVERENARLTAQVSAMGAELQSGQSDLERATSAVAQLQDKLRALATKASVGAPAPAPSSSSSSVSVDGGSASAAIDVSMDEGWDYGAATAGGDVTSSGGAATKAAVSKADLALESQLIDLKVCPLFATDPPTPSSHAQY